jgi:hypothetical protein
MMKKAFLLAAVATALTLTACQKEDDVIDVSQLVGQWGYFNDDPRLAVDGSLTYTFDQDGRYTLVVYDFLSDRTATHRGTYQVSIDSQLIILSRDDDGDYSGQYLLLKLNAREMRWKEVAYDCEPRKSRFLRVTD